MTITELVAASGATLKVFDMGRRIQAMDPRTFQQIEGLRHPYPSPYLKHAWLGLLSCHPTRPEQNGIWFLKLPLDEQNLLEPASRDAFVRYCADRMVSGDQSDQGEAPCSFKPDANRMAYFHAVASRDLGAENSRFYGIARAYLSGDMGWENWQQLGLQGLAEVVAGLDRDDNQTLLAQAIGFLPSVPLNVVLGFLESQSPGQLLTSAINDRLAAVIKDGATPADLAAFARALSHSQNIQQRRLLLQAMLQHHESRSIEVLAAISSRCWADLEGPLLLVFLEALACNEQGQDAFIALVGDMMTLPGMRHRMLAAFADESRSDTLNDAIQALLKIAQRHMQ